MTDSDYLQALVDDGGEVRLEPRPHILTRPLVIPPERGLTLSGAGIGITELVVTDGESAIVGIRDRPAGCITLRDFSIHPGTRPRAGAAISLTAPRLFAAQRGHAAECIIERVEVRGDSVGTFAYGVYLDNLAGPKIDKCWVSGRFGDITAEALSDPDAMRCMWWMGGSQEAKLTNSYGACARRGVYVHGNGPGCGEGVEVSGCAIICCDEPIVLEGVRAGVYGGFATPWALVQANHLFYNIRGILAINRSDLVIGPNSICGSHLVRPVDEQVGAYLVSCANTRISGASFWNPSASGRVQGYGVVAVNCSRGIIGGVVVDPSLRVGAWMLGSNPGWHASGNAWGSRLGVTDSAGQPITLPS